MTSPTMPHPLGRVLHHDPRSRDYPARTAPRALGTVLHRLNAAALDQKTTSACTGFAAAQCINTVGYYPERRKLNKARFLGYDDAISLYSRATALDEFGWRFPPRDNGSSSLGVAKALKERGWITEYRHAFGIDHMLGALALAPCLVGTTWRTEMYYPNAAGRISVGGHAVGGHEYLAVGANYSTEMLRFRNSWGPSYGVNGDMYISFEDFDALLKDDGDVMILVGSVP